MGAALAQTMEGALSTGKFVVTLTASRKTAQKIIWAEIDQTAASPMIDQTRG